MTFLAKWRELASPEARRLTDDCADMLKAHAQLWRAIGRLTERRADGRATLSSNDLESTLRDDAAGLELAWRAAGGEL